MWSNDNPFSFYYFTLWSVILSNITLGIKVGIVSFCAFIPLPIYLIIKKFSQNEMAALFGAFVSIFNPLLFRMMGDFVKNAMSVFFLLFFIYFFIITCEKKYPIKKTILFYGISLSLFILIVLTHIYATGFAIGFVFIYFMYSIIHTVITERKFPWTETKLVLFLGISGGLTFVIGYLLNPDYFYHFSKFIDFISGLFDAIFPSYETSTLALEQTQYAPDLLLNPIEFFVLGIISIVGVSIIVYDLIKKRKNPPIFQFLGFALIVYFPTYLIIPNLHQLMFNIPPALLMDILNFLTTIPVAAGIALVCFEIYKNDPKMNILNRIKGNLLSIFLMCILLALPIISMEWRTRFVLLNFIPLSVFIGYPLKKLNIGRRKVAAFAFIGFFATSMIIQTNYFCYYSFRSYLRPEGEEDLLFLKNYVENNSTLTGSKIIVANMEFFYFTILITGLDVGYPGNPSEIARQYNETVFVVIENIRQFISVPSGQEVIRNETNGQFIIILANYTYHD